MTLIPKPLADMMLDFRVVLAIARHHEVQARGKPGRAARRHREEAERMRRLASAIKGAEPPPSLYPLS